MCRRLFGVIFFLLGLGFIALTIGLGYSLFTGHRKLSSDDLILLFPLVFSILLLYLGYTWGRGQVIGDLSGSLEKANSKNYEFLDISRLTRLLKILLYISMAGDIISLISYWFQLELLRRGVFSYSERLANDERQAIIALFSFTLFLITGVMFARWIYCANRNVRDLGAQNLRFTPGWAVGSFFIPIGFLWLPYQAMKDLWRASKNPADLQSVKTGFVLRGWWTLLIIFFLLGNTLFHAGTSDLLEHTIRYIIYYAVKILICIVTIILVSQIFDSQMNKKESANGIMLDSQ